MWTETNILIKKTLDTHNNKIIKKEIEHVQMKAFYVIWLNNTYMKIASNITRLTECLSIVYKDYPLPSQIVILYNIKAMKDGTT